MSLLDLARLLARRWIVAVAVAAMTVAGGAAVYVASGDAYSIEADFLFQPGFEGAGISVPLPVALSQRLASGDIRNAVVEEVGAAASYETSADGAFVNIRSTAEDAEAARATVQAVLDRLDGELSAVAENLGTDAAEAQASVVAAPGVREVTPEGLSVVASSVLVVEPAEPSNPFTRGDYAAQVTQAATEAAIAAGVLSIRPSDELQLTSDLEQPVPIVEVVLTAGEEAEAVRLYEDLLELMQTNLEEVQEQAGISPSRRAQVRPLLGNPTPELTPAVPLRSLVAVLVLGAVLAVLLALAVDAAVERRAAQDRTVARQDRPARDRVPSRRP